MPSFPFTMQGTSALYNGYRKKGKDLPVFWGILRKASKADDIVYYRTDPDLSITDKDILLQGARPLYTEGGAKNRIYCFDFTRENLDDLFRAEVSTGDVLLFWILISGRFIALDRTKTSLSQVIGLKKCWKMVFIFCCAVRHL